MLPWAVGMLDDWNDEAFAELDAIEAACRNRVPLENQPPQQQQQQPPHVPRPPAEPAWQPHTAMRQMLMPGAAMPALAPGAGSSHQHATLGAGRVAPPAAPAPAGPPASQQVARPPAQPFDPEAIKTWVYPSNVQERQYQFEISSVAVRHNTLVSLPTGLGKTLIASVTMYKYARAPSPSPRGS